MSKILRSTNVADNILTALVSRGLTAQAFLMSLSFFKRLLRSFNKTYRENNIDKNTEIKTLYIHVPFCKNPCKFCCFLRFRYREEYYRNYMKMLQKELDNVVSMFELKSVDVYIGGGTPTVNQEGILELLDKIHELVKPRTVTVEANPATLRDTCFIGELSKKVTRLSIGVQSFCPRILNTIGRINHTVVDSLVAVRNTLKKFHTVNVDLLWSVPGQTVIDIIRDCKIIAELGVDQVTLYPVLAPPWRDLRKVLQDYITYRTLVEFLLKLNFKPRTVWCFSRDGNLIDEYIVESRNFLGIGAGSISKVGNRVLANAFSLTQYMKKVRANGVSFSYVTTLRGVEESLFNLVMNMFEYGNSRNMSLMFIVSELLRTLFFVVAWFRFTALTLETCYSKVRMNTIAPSGLLAPTLMYCLPNLSIANLAQYVTTHIIGLTGCIVQALFS